MLNVNIVGTAIANLDYVAIIFQSTLLFNN